MTTLKQALLGPASPVTDMWASPPDRCAAHNYLEASRAPWSDTPISRASAAGGPRKSLRRHSLLRRAYGPTQPICRGFFCSGNKGALWAYVVTYTRARVWLCCQPERAADFESHHS